MSFKHLTKTARLQLEILLKSKTSKKEIAKLLDVHISTVYREIERGTYQHLDSATYEYKTQYSADLSDEKYRQNLHDKGADLKISNDYKLANYIEKRIVNDKLSPLAVLGEIKAKKLKFKTTISVNTLYSYIDKQIFKVLTNDHLMFKSRQRKNKRKSIVIKRISKGTSIEKRPSEINSRNTFGHWEMDCVCGPSKATLLVLTERLTRKEIIMQMNNQKSDSVITCLNILEKQYGKSFKKIFKSITVDNGSEFKDYQALEKSRYGKTKRIDIYYCHPYCSSERGTNERINREIRRLIPKGSDLSLYTKRQIQHVEDWVNSYPRQIFNFHTSNELFNKQLKLLAI